MKSNPTLPVAAVTKHFPKNNIKSPIPLITATCRALSTIVLKAYNKFMYLKDNQCIFPIMTIILDLQF